MLRKTKNSKMSNSQSKKSLKMRNSETKKSKNNDIELVYDSYMQNLKNKNYLGNYFSKMNRTQHQLSKEHELGQLRKQDNVGIKAAQRR